MPRIAEILKKGGTRFEHRVYTDQEISYCRSKASPAIHFAGRFAAKEALKKAFMSAEVKQVLSFSNIEITNNGSGVPKVHMHYNNLQFIDLKVSISHNSDQAIAFALLRL